jgi:hypothetical protein
MSTQEEIMGLERKFWQSMADMDVDTAAALLDEQSTSASGQGIHYFDPAQYKSMALSGDARITSFELSDERVIFPTPDVAIASYKEKLESSEDTDTILTKALSGRWARGIRNKMISEIELSGIPIPPYPLQNSLTAKFRQLAQKNNDADYTSLWAGQSAGMQNIKQAKEVFRDLVMQYESLYG